MHRSLLFLPFLSISGVKSREAYTISDRRHSSYTACASTLLKFNTRFHSSQVPAAKDVHIMMHSSATLYGSTYCADSGIRHAMTFIPPGRCSSMPSRFPCETIEILKSRALIPSDPEH